MVAILQSGDLVWYDVYRQGFAVRRVTYRITRAGLDAFKAERSAMAPTQPQKRFRHKAVPAVREFF